MPATWSVRDETGTAVLTLAPFRAIRDGCGDCVARSAAELRETAAGVTAAAVVIDLTRAEMMPGKILGAVIVVWRELSGRGVDCRVRAAGAVRELFALTKLDRLIPLDSCPDGEDRR